MRIPRVSTLIKFTNWLSSAKPAQTNMSRRSFLGLGAVAASAVILPRCTDPNNTWMHYEQGVRLYNDGYYPEAVEELALYNDAYLNSLENKSYFDPESAKDSLYLTAKTYDKKLKLYPEAAASYQLALDCFPDAQSAEKATFRLGDIYYKELKEYEPAIEQFELYLERFSYEAQDAAQVVANIAGIYEYHLEDPIKAIEAYQRLVDYFPDHIEVIKCYSRMAKLYEKINDYGHAAVAWKNYLNYCQDEAKAEKIVLKLIDIYENVLQDHKSAIEIRKYYINRFSQSKENKVMQLKIAELYEKLEDYEQAIKEYYLILEYETVIGDYTLNHISQIYLYKLGQLDKGIAVLKVRLEKFNLTSDHFKCACVQFQIGEAYEKFNESFNAANYYMAFLATVWGNYDIVPYLKSSAIIHASDYVQWYCSQHDCSQGWENN